jgi:NDP-sugar pyrophosphorylase family protein
MKHQDGASFNLKLEKIASEKPDWESQDVVSTKNDQSLAHVSQSKNAKTDVQFFNGKGGFSAIVSTNDLRMIALPGSHLELSDTVLDLPGARIMGSPIESDLDTEQAVQQVTTQAMITGAGLSTRFEPIAGDVTGFAKPSTPLVGEDSVITNTARHLHKHGIRNILINTYYKPEVLKKQMKQLNETLIKDGKEPIRFTFIDEKAPSGDAGGLSAAFNQEKYKGAVNPKEPLLIVMGDAVTNVDFSTFLNAVKEHKAKVSIGCKHVRDQDLGLYGFAVTDQSGEDKESGYIQQFVEKPGTQDTDEPVAEKMKKLGNSRLANAAFIVLSPEVFDEFKQQGHAFQQAGKTFGFSHHFYPTILDKYRNNKAMWAERVRGYWADIGNPEQFIATVKDIANGKMGSERAQKVKEQLDEMGVLYWPGTRSKVDDLRSKAHYEGSPFQLDGNIVVANAPKG